MSKIFHPFGAVDTVALTAGGTQAITINNQLTMIDGETVKQTTARTLNLTIGVGVRAGAIIHLAVECNDATAGNRNVIFGTGFVCETLQPVNVKELRISFMYNGTAFIPMGGKYEEA
jgi:hypothetical protein